ncbi:MAG: non-canonical purine NTP pyrophosphatase [Phycisphaeraceae bacterium]|nr:MAG: non-canonical purine NTP pyrophosphatase [Phycisphaeraceae bacterium]
MTPPQLVIATANPHKLEELRAIFAPHRIRFRSLADFPDDIPEPDESADSFLANATIKATAYARATGHPCLADDSGLEVDALDGQPGVHSAYYAGTEGSRAERDQRNNAKLLGALAHLPEGHPGRAARFVCTMVLASPEGDILATSRGEFPGVITSSPRGENGFGYDPLLLLPDGRTSAELPPDEKNARSHRAAAARIITPDLVRLGFVDPS